MPPQKLPEPRRKRIHPDKVLEALCKGNAFPESEWFRDDPTEWAELKRSLAMRCSAYLFEVLSDVEDAEVAEVL